MRTLTKFGFTHAIWLGDRKAISIAKGPIKTLRQANAFGNGEHQSGSAGDQCRQQRMEEFPGLFDLHRVDGEALALGPVAAQPFWGIQIGDVYLDKDSVARRIRQDLQSLLLAVEYILVQSRRILKPCLDGRAQVDQALKKIIVGGVNLIVGIAGNLTVLKPLCGSFGEKVMASMIFGTLPLSNLEAMTSASVNQSGLSLVR